jgi:hypothetical protein
LHTGHRFACSDALFISGRELQRAKEILVTIVLLARTFGLRRATFPTAGAVAPDHPGRPLAIPRDMRVHDIARPWIRDLNHFVPVLSITRAKRDGVAALKVIGASRQP